MPTVQPIVTLNIDNNALNVADLSTKVQQLVTVYNEWNQKLADAQTNFALTQAALNDLSRQIIVQIKQDQDEAAAKAAADVAPAANDAVVADVAPAAVTTDASPDSTPTAKE